MAKNIRYYFLLGMFHRILTLEFYIITADLLLELVLLGSVLVLELVDVGLSILSPLLRCHLRITLAILVLILLEHHVELEPSVGDVLLLTIPLLASSLQLLHLLSNSPVGRVPVLLIVLKKVRVVIRRLLLLTPTQLPILLLLQLSLLLRIPPLSHRSVHDLP